MTELIKILGLFLLLFLGQIANGQVDNYSKNKKLFEDEQKRFENELQSNKDTAEVYWKHANVIANFTFNAQKDAWKYYEQALSIDSSKVIYFVDYGKYLLEMNYLNDAKELYERGLNIFSSNEELNSGMEDVKEKLSKIEEERRLRSFGNASSTSHSKAEDYKEITDFEKLCKKTKDKKSPFFYTKLLDKFNSDIQLTDEQVYMLLLGLTQQDNYKPYTLVTDQVYELNSQQKFNEAINKANELLEKNPLLPSLYVELMYAYRKIGNETLAEKCQNKIQSILNAMLYTGDGTCDKPYVAFWLAEEYTLLDYLGFVKTGGVNSGVCAGQMADKIQVTNFTTKFQTEICFNVKLLIKTVMSKN